MTEIWKQIPTYPYYEASNLGRIRSLDKKVRCKGKGFANKKGIVKKLQVNKNGYLITTLSSENKVKTFTVHQLVALAFFPNFMKGTELNHIDGNKQNAVLTNLELSNPSHNQLHALRIKLKIPTGASKYHHVSYRNEPKAKAKWVVCIRHNGKSSYGWRSFMTEMEAAIYADELLDSIGDTERLRNFP